MRDRCGGPALDQKHRPFQPPAPNWWKATPLTRRAFAGGATACAMLRLGFARAAVIARGVKIGPISSIEGYGAALRTSSTISRFALVEIGADWCEFCQIITERILPNPEVAELLAEMALIRIDVTSMSESNKKLLTSLAVDGPPTVFVSDTHTGREYPKTRSVGSFDAESLITRLQHFAR